MTDLPDTGVERPYGEPPVLDAKPDYKVAFKRTLAKFSQDQCTDLAAALTYYSIQAMVPAMIAGVSLLGLFGDGKETTNSVVTSIAAIAGTDESELGGIRNFIDGLQTSGGAGFAFFFGILLSLWSASGYVGAFARMQNRIYDVAEGRPVFKLRPWLYLVTIIQVILLVIAAMALVMTGPVAKEVGSLIGLGDTAVMVWDIAKWPFVVLIVMFIIGLMFWATPNVRRPFKQGIFNPGAVLAFFVWVIGSAAFAWYVSNMGNYGKYGQLATAIMVLLWLWITNLAMLFGAEFDAETLRTRQLKTGYPAEELVLLPVRDESGIDKKAEKYDDLVEAAHQLRVDSGVPDEAVENMMPVVPAERSNERTTAAQSSSPEKQPVTPSTRTLEGAPKIAAATKDEAPDLSDDATVTKAQRRADAKPSRDAAAQAERERAEVAADREQRRRRALAEGQHKRAVRERLAAQEAKVKAEQKKVEAERLKEAKKAEAERPLEEKWAEVESNRARYDHPNTREFRAVSAEREDRRRRWFEGKRG